MCNGVEAATLRADNERLQRQVAELQKEAARAGAGSIGVDDVKRSLGLALKQLQGDCTRAVLRARQQRDHFKRSVARLMKLTDEQAAEMLNQGDGEDTSLELSPVDELLDKAVMDLFPKEEEEKKKKKKKRKKF